MQVAVGVDIGGSHITSAGVDLETNKVITGTTFRGDIDNKAPKEKILQDWGSVINRTLAAIGTEEILGVGFAMPGPFDYRKGVAMFEGNDKYESLYKVSIASDLPNYLERDQDFPLRFLNDASSFGVGGILSGKMEREQNVVAVTLGTGFGAAFLENGIPVEQGNNIPEDGCLWDKSFKDGIADDYFSTRWFVSRYKEIKGKTCRGGVKEIVALNDDGTEKVFQEFAKNFNEFMIPYLLKFEANLLVIGGNIAKSKELFLPLISNNPETGNLDIAISFVEDTEEANIIGASYLFDNNFWKKVG